MPGAVPPGGPQVVSSAFVEKDSKFLLVLCPRFRVWRVPGGRPRIGESLEQALAREMEEELGIRIKNPRFLGYGQDHQYDFLKKKETSRLLMFFHVRITEEPRIDPDEALESKWVTFEELRKHENKEGALNEFLKKGTSLRL
jgi:ADP-ribose pyrophosphatase YjhB (NUDIX family)